MWEEALAHLEKVELDKAGVVLTEFLNSLDTDEAAEYADKFLVLYDEREEGFKRDSEEISNFINELKDFRDADDFIEIINRTVKKRLA